MRGAESFTLVDDEDTDPETGLVETLPLSSDVIRRVTALAAAHEMLVVPLAYTPRVDPGAVGSSQTQFVVSASADQGPLIVVSLQAPAGRGAALVQLQTSGRMLQDGRARADDLFELPATRGQHLLTSPIVVDRGDSLIIDTQLGAADEWGPLEVWRVGVLAFREVRGGVLAVPGPAADHLAMSIRAQGEWYAAGVITPPGQEYVPVSGGDIVVETLTLACDEAGENETAPSKVELWIGDTRVTPDPDFRPAASTGSGLSLEYVAVGLRMPMRATTRARVSLTWPVTEDEQLPVRYVLQGRRIPGQGGPQ